MTPEDKFNVSAWYVLQKVKELSLYTRTDDPILYDFYLNFIVSGTPTIEQQVGVLQKLKEWGAIDFHNTQRTAKNRLTTEITLSQKFDEIYKKFEPKQTFPLKEKRGGLTYVYNNYDVPSGTLKIGDIEILFNSMPATILNFFYVIKKVDSSYKNYKDFNEYSKEELDSDKFNKSIAEINLRINNETSGFIKDLLLRKENKKNQPNIYCWNPQFE